MATLASQLQDKLDVNEVVRITSDLVSIESHRDAPGRESAAPKRSSRSLPAGG